MKQRLKHLPKIWGSLLGKMLLGWVIYLPIYLFYAFGFWLSMRLTHLLDIDFWQALGMVILVRYAKNLWIISGKMASKPTVEIYKQPYQVPESALQPGLCMYGDRLLLNTPGDGLFDAQTGQPFVGIGLQFSPTQTN
ncbi:hypothetical protein [Spirosoma sp.]|uniref:hypothetical protein n=1 Tax=Spirosoma sp. TaxID=1899569 RepID=UPI002606CE6C|nr:hypothetical protein [Spirosoma sp.]MCX6217680.1 hypothetical protein [Spirosoma sp.]